MRKKALVGVALMAVSTVFVDPADGADYVVDPARSELVVQITKGGVAAAVAHNHVVRASEFVGEAFFDPEDLSFARLRVEAQTRSLVVDEPEVRNRYGLTKKVGERDRKKIRETMLSRGQMDAESYPTLGFESTGVERSPEGKYTLTGNLIIHGVERPITFPITLEEEGGGLRARATIPFKQSDFGIRPYSAMLGAVRNRDEAVLHVDIFATPAQSAVAGE